MMLVTVHWAALSIVGILTSFVNAYQLIKFVDECRRCTKSDYIRKHAKKEVVLMQRIFLGLAIVIAAVTIVSRFTGSSESGFYGGRATSEAVSKVYLYGLYLLFGFNLLTFLNFAIIKNKCRSSNCPSKLKERWAAVKIWNSLFIGICFSYIVFRRRCPRQVFGLPGRGTCNRILCQNNIYSAGRLQKLKKRMADAAKKYPDESKQIREVGLYDEGGKFIRGSEPTKFSETVRRIELCAQNAADEVGLMGFKAESWRKKCSGFEESEKRLKDREKIEREAAAPKKDKRPSFYDLFRAPREDKKKAK